MSYDNGSGKIMEEKKKWTLPKIPFDVTKLKVGYLLEMNYWEKLYLVLNDDFFIDIKENVFAVKEKGVYRFRQGLFISKIWEKDEKGNFVLIYDKDKEIENE